MKYDVFVSYSRPDRADAVKLEAALMSAGLKVFRDERELGVGEHVEVALPEAHNASAVVVVLWSDNSAKSRWVYKEAIGAIFSLKYYPLKLEGF
ncbi:MAG: TIR domain-containing protein [Actinomycetales bacterium]|nr:TIR domain-containing protein [Actinomycetales bacterium]